MQLFLGGGILHLPLWVKCSKIYPFFRSPAVSLVWVSLMTLDLIVYLQNLYRTSSLNRTDRMINNKNPYFRLKV